MNYLKKTFISKLVVSMLICIFFLKIFSMTPSTFGEPDIQAPTAPANLASTSKTDTSVRLDWSISTDDVGVTEYEVYNGAVLMGSVTSTTYTVTGLTNNTTYSFTIKAKDAAGNRSDGAMLNVTTDGANLLNNGDFENYTGTSGVADSWSWDPDGTYAVVTNPVVQGLYAQQMNMLPKNQGYFIDLWKSIAITSGKSYVFKGKFTIAQVDKAKVQLYLDFSDAQGNWLDSKIKELTGVTSGYVEVKTGGTVPPNATRVVAHIIVRSTGTAGTATIYVDDINLSYSTEDVEVPTVPASVTLTGMMETSIDLAWNASLDNTGVTGYEVYNGNMLVGTTNSTNYHLTGLNKATTYVLTIKAYDAVGNKSLASQPLSVTTDDVLSAWKAFAKNVGLMDPNASEGATIATSVVTSTNNVFHLMSVQDQKKLYIYVKGTNLNTDNIVYIDSDNDSTTGYHSSLWTNSGIDYKIENNRLFQFINSSATWIKAGSVYTDVNPNYVGSYLYLDMIGKTAPGVMKVAYISKSSINLPENGQSMLDVSAGRQRRGDEQNCQRENTDPETKHFWDADVPFFRVQYKAEQTREDDNE